MIGFAVRRLGWGLLVIWGVATAVFFLTMSIPSDPAKMIAGPHARPETVRQIRANLGLDEPLVVQYARFITRLVVKLDLGRSYQRREEVLDGLIERFPRTAALAVGAILVQLLIGIPIGILNAVRKGTWADHTGMVGALFGISAPTFWLGVMLLYFLSFQLGAFPMGGYGDTFLEHVHHLILPCLTLGITGAAYYSRILRSEMLEVLGLDYVRTAKAKGLEMQDVVMRHVLRNSLIPVVTMLGLDVGVLMGGAVVTESIFAIPGIGKFAIEGIFNVDVPVIMGTVLFASALMVLANILVDLVYAWLDPRIRLA
ncbi:MAG: ABC transporter permease [Candidatus Schekmanbacteria bacterium]|nr:ABC transporter permease [Candidatus Schekmanbacteria bacterium]